MCEEDKSSNFWIYAISLPFLYVLSVFPVGAIIGIFKLRSEIIESSFKFFYAPLILLSKNCQHFDDFMDMIFEFIKKTFC